jgi:hypothetical protein
MLAGRGVILMVGRWRTVVVHTVMRRRHHESQCAIMVSLVHGKLGHLKWLSPHVLQFNERTVRLLGVWVWQRHLKVETTGDNRILYG